MTTTFPGGFQTTMVEYLVRQGLDGQTPAPPLGPLLENKPLPAQGYRFEVDRLGLIDLSFDLPDANKLDPVTIGWRYIPWMHISGGNLFLVGANTEVGYFRTPGDPESFARFVELDGIGQQLTYSRKGYCVPQGQTFRLSGVNTALGGPPIRVRFGVIIPRSEEEEQAIREAFCCTSSIPTIDSIPGPVDCPECNCPFGAISLTDDGGSPVVPPILLAPGEVSGFFRLSGSEINAATVLAVSADPPNDPFSTVQIVDQEFLPDTCEFRFRFSVATGAQDGAFNFSVENLCFDTCIAIFNGLGQIVGA